ncbi:superfamily 6 holin (LLH) [Tumebacillus sp. BK434]|uniref:hypothetical protein n=1 Tax=Tumebacillus sp. BK434 TaxID=2512169 RepID=UPI0010469632|nr:hypothetical protein [Tumebacillus sp. BK434]TCP53733.1 superfamily 6 holin (LLH) [Tumebacillus sp. BK434]
MTEQILGMLQDGVSIVLQLAVLAGLLLLRNLKQRMQNYYDAQTTLQNRQLLAQLGREAFSYAETVYTMEDGPAKMNEAIKYLMDKCGTCGMQDVPMKDMRAVIESAWLEDRRGAAAPASASLMSAAPGSAPEPARLITGEER